MKEWHVMSELYREHHPLLSEELCDEAYSPQFHRRLRPVNFRGRARNNLKGAAAIITRWPDHWASFITYWWIGLGMISLMTFIVYNSFSFPLIHIANSKPVRSAVTHTIGSTTHISPLLHDVFMHIFVEENAEVELNEYVPYIEKISNKYTQFNYHLLVVFNDTKMKPLSAEQNNEIALKSLWVKDKGMKKYAMKKNSIINIGYTSLTAYMDNSPLKKYWRTLPSQLIEFLVRAVSVWNRGGITFNPNILKPRSPHTIYIDKLKKLLHKFPFNHADTSYTENVAKKIKKSDLKNKNKQKLNNIRDIINALENNDDSINVVSHEILAETEDKEVPVITQSEPHLYTAARLDDTSESKITKEPVNYTQMQPNTASVTNITKELFDGQHNGEFTNINLENGSNASSPSLLPLFLKYLFHSVPSNEIQPTEATNAVHRKRKSVIRNHESNSLFTHPNNDNELKNTYEPIIISAVAINKSNLDDKVIEILPGNEIQEKILTDRLTIDLKGNIIATDTPCHAFLGTIFSNAIHHNEEETVSDFIIAELSVFCKGLLSSCVGIDLILL